MTTTPNLGITHVAASQAQKEVTLNDALSKLDLALTDTVDVSVAAGNAMVGNADFRENIALKVTGAAVAGRTVTVPAIKRLFVVISDVANTEDVTIVRGAATVTLPAGATLICYTDGTTDGLIAASSAGGTGGGGRADNLPARRLAAGAAGRGAAHLSSSRRLGSGAADRAPRQRRQGEDGGDGAGRFRHPHQRRLAGDDALGGGGNHGAVFIWAADVDIAPGDEIEIIAPGPADDTLADLTWTIEGAVGNPGDVNLADFWEAELPVEPAAVVQDIIGAADAAAARATLGLTAAYDGALAGAYANRIINGDMRICQRFGGVGDPRRQHRLLSARPLGGVRARGRRATAPSRWRGRRRRSPRAGLSIRSASAPPGPRPPPATSSGYSKSSKG